MLPYVTAYTISVANPVKKYFLPDLVAPDMALKEIDTDCSGISKRTIQNDIIYMETAEGFNVPIVHYVERKKSTIATVTKTFH